MFIDESDKYEHIPLYESIVHEGLAPREKVQIKFYRSGKLDQHE
ncbi:MAG TPA: hypothetical protein PLP19_09355 [bacterium]|nr:hypothetical protein [bacterium]HPN43683.1 hypothetical protein [bacterium]